MKSDSLGILAERAKKSVTRCRLWRCTSPAACVKRCAEEVDSEADVEEEVSELLALLGPEKRK